MSYVDEHLGKDREQLHGVIDELQAEVARLKARDLLPAQAAARDDMLGYIKRLEAKCAHYESWQESTLELLVEAEVQIDVLYLDDFDLERERRNLKNRILAEVAKCRAGDPEFQPLDAEGRPAPLGGEPT